MKYSKPFLRQFKLPQSEYTTMEDLTSPASRVQMNLWIQEGIKRNERKMALAQERRLSVKCK